MNRTEVGSKFAEIIARHIDIKDQIASGIEEAKLDRDRWIGRYRGEHPTDGAIVFNTFYPEVNQVVGLLMLAIDSDKGSG